MKKFITTLLMFYHIIGYSQAVNSKDIQNFVTGKLLNTSYKIKNIEAYNYHNKTVFYFVDLSPKGFMIVAGDYRVQPILAYSYEHNRGKLTTNSNIEYMLNTYAKQIDNIPDSNKIKNTNWFTTNTRQRSTNTVSPLLSTNWGQASGYNQYCPADANGPGGHAYTGCVATAAAQIMYYLRPDQGFGHHTYIHDTYGTLSADFANTTYDWSAMENNDMQAIALLMYHAGVAVEMNYGPNQSNASVYNDQNIDLHKSWQAFFQINNDYIKKQNYSDADWKNIIKTDLDNNKPVLYSGDSSTSCGHAWVCDGYDSNDLFHMNWGWGGAYNGYYNLDNLTPGNRDYTQHQNVLHNIEINSQYQCAFDVAEQNAGLYLNNDEFRNCLYLSENEGIVSCLTQGDQDWYIIEFDNNGITEQMDILVTGATAQSQGNYILRATRNANLLTIETQSYGNPVDTKIAWKCMCYNGNFPKIVMEDDNSGENGIFSKLIIDLDQIEYTDIPDMNFMTALNFKDIAPNPFLPHIFTEYINDIPLLELNYSNINDFTGIEGFENLEEFWCHHNNITSLDVSQNHQLKTLICRNNNLTSLLLNPEIEKVYARTNHLISMDLTTCTQLREMSFNQNNLQDFDLRNGNYQNITYFRLTDNPDLSCVFVDNKTYFNSHWNNAIDNTAIYVENTNECEILTDTENPVAICQNITVTLDSNGIANITPSQIDNGSTDNTGIVNYALSNSHFNCNNLGDNTVILAVVDGAGNIGQCSSIVTVIDNENPTAIGQNLQLDLAGNTSVATSANDINNGSYDNCGIVNMSISQDTFTATGTYTIDFTVTDSSSNNDTAQVNINVIDSSLKIFSHNIKGLQVYPNPTNDILHIKANEPIAIVTISDLSGKEIIKLHPQKTEINLNLKMFSKGIYLIKIENANNEMHWQKIIRK